LNGTVGVGDVNYVLLSGLVHLDCRSLGTKTCLRASSVLFGDGSVTMITGASRMIEFQTVTFSRLSDLSTLYTGTSMQELITGIPILHIQFATSLPYQISNLIVHNSDETTQLLAREVPFNSSAHRGFAISVPSIGNYTFTSPSTGLLCRALSVDNITTFAALTDGDTFYDNAGIAEEEVPCHPPTPPPRQSMTPVPTAGATDRFTVAHLLTRRNGLRRAYICSFSGFTFLRWAP
jgi:hypothetical protein